jgi:hypothetical protein
LNEIRPDADDPQDQATAPVVAYEIDRTVTLQSFELADEPHDVLLLRGPETVRSSAPETGELKGDDVVTLQMRTEGIPENGGLGDTVNEDGRHVHSLARPALHRPLNHANA